jgi:hypothetical protein
MENERKITITKLALNQFAVGQPLTVKFMIPSGYAIFCDAEFIGIEKGLVKIKLIAVQSPEWYRFNQDLSNRYPNYIGKFRAKNCFVWGKSDGEFNLRCHWFKDTKTPAV